VIRLLLDQGLPRSTALKLRERGWDVVHVGEIGSSRATDQEILQRGRTDGRVVLRPARRTPSTIAALKWNLWLNRSER